MNCPHPERPNVLCLPSIGNPHCCRECFDARQTLRTPYKGKREAWEESYERYGGYHNETAPDGRVLHPRVDPSERIWK